MSREESLRRRGNVKIQNNIKTGQRLQNETRQKAYACEKKVAALVNLDFSVSK
jgi:hypothetical protein